MEILDNNKSSSNQKRARFATYWIRVAAYVIDTIVLLPIIIVGVYDLLMWKSLPLYILSQIPVLLYKPFMEYKYGATLGKMAVKTKVVNAELEDISLNQALNRNVLFFANSLMGIISGVLVFYKDGFYDTRDMNAIAEMQANSGNASLSAFVTIAMMTSCIFVAVDLRKQALHDKIGDTYVVSAEDLRRNGGVA